MTEVLFTPMHQLILQEIRQHGSMTFARFVELALYHPTYGYYHRRSPQRGRLGDYFTAPQVGGVMPQIVGESVIAMKKTLGTEQFALVEMGSGDGEFLHGLLSHLESKNELKGLRVFAIERGRGAREKLSKRLSRFPRCVVAPSLEDLDLVGGVEGCLFSNEFFDALPFRRLRFRSGRWVEIGVGIDAQTLCEVEYPTDLAGPVSADFSEGSEVELRPTVSHLYEEWGRFLNRGYILTFDYGYPRPQLQAPHRQKGTWLCYYKHQHNTNPFLHVGDQDITAHVDFTQLAEEGQQHHFSPRLFCSQGLFLTHAGKNYLPEWLKQGDENTRAKKISALQQLIHPDAMGETFKVLVQTKEAELLPEWAEIPNRLRRLGL